jgi:hypothetical protein
MGDRAAYIAPAVSDVGNLEDLTQVGPPGPGGSTTKVFATVADYTYPNHFVFNFS